MIAALQLLAADLGTIRGPGGFDPSEDGSDAPTRFTDFATTLLSFLTILAGLAFLLYFVLGAINWITSSGDQQKVEAARNQMTAAGIGLVIVVAAYAIAGVAGGILGIDILNPQSTISELGPGGTGE